MSIEINTMWEIWYSATFRPTEIQKKFSSGRSGDQLKFLLHSLLFFPNSKLISNFFFLVILFNTPLLIKILSSGESADIFLLILSLCAAYLAGLINLSLGIHFPLVFAVLYTPGIINYVYTKYLGQPSVALGLILVWLILFFITRNNLQTSIPDNTKLTKSKIIAIASLLTTLILSFITELGLILYESPHYAFYQIAIAIWVISFSSAPSDANMSGVFITPVLMIALMIYYKNPAWLLPTLVIPIGFLRLFPDYLIWSSFCIYLLKIDSIFNRNQANNLVKLPPFVNEILWLPIFGHQKLITNAFKIDPEQMCELARESVNRSSLNNPIMLALPHIIFERLSRPNSVFDLSVFGDKTNPLTKLVSVFLVSTSDSVRIGMSQGEIEAEVLLPRIVKISENINTLVSSEAREDEYLKRKIGGQLSDFEIFLLDLNFKENKKEKWTTLLTNWKNIFENYALAV